MKLLTIEGSNQAGQIMGWLFTAQNVTVYSLINGGRKAQWTRRDLEDLYGQRPMSIYGWAKFFSLVWGLHATIHEI